MTDPTLFDKVCSRCGLVKDALTDFYRQRHCRDGLNGVCKECFNRSGAERYHTRTKFDPAARAGRKLASRRRWEKVRDDPDLLAAHRTATEQWRARNKDRMSDSYRSWRLANADKVREKNQRRRARLLGAFVAPVDPAVIWERDNGVCQLCRAPVDPELEWPHRWCGTIDHIIPLAGGGTHEPGNVQLAHHSCNSRKNDRASSG